MRARVKFKTSKLFKLMFSMTLASRWRIINNRNIRNNRIMSRKSSIKPIYFSIQTKKGVKTIKVIWWYRNQLHSTGIWVCLKTHTNTKMKMFTNAKSSLDSKYKTLQKKSSKPRSNKEVSSKWIKSWTIDQNNKNFQINIDMVVHCQDSCPLTY